MRPLVKICGLKRAEDAELAVSLGATHVGVLRSPSPRQVSVEEAKELFAAVGLAVRKVLLFKGASVKDVVADARATGADFVQLYFATDADVGVLGSEGLGVIRVYDMVDSLPRFETPPTERTPALLDVGGGGSGRRFDWNLLKGKSPEFTFIAGGITPSNVAALLSHRPYGIDLSSGVEREPGVKDAEKLKRLFERIKDFEPEDSA